MRPILIDTNFWLLPFEKRVDWLGQLDGLCEDEPFRLLVPKPVQDELRMMAGQEAKRKNTRAARGALAAIDRLKKAGRLEICDIAGPADGSLITLALQTGAWVATNDRQLRERLREKKIRQVVLQDEHKLGLA